MNDRTAGGTLPSPTGLIAGGLVVLGVLLWMFVSKGLLFVAGLGAFGPGILRELGWLRDSDEFQRQSAHRAGYHAYLIGGLCAVFVLSGLEWSGTGSSGGASEWIRLVLLLLWMTWLFSALLAYWGVHKTVTRVLLAFGSFWAVFVIASLLGEADPAGDLAEGLLGVLMGFVFVAPFFVLAWTSGRWPRRTGGVLLAVAALFFIMTAPMGGLGLSTVLLTDAMLLVPLVGSGIALLRDRGSEAPSGHDPETYETVSTR